MWHTLVLLGFLFYAFLGLSTGWYHTRNKNYFGLTPWFILLGSFVWTDTVILGAFWTITNIALLLYNHQLISLLVYSLFWTVRSSGEIVYWIHEQFAHTKRNPPHTLFLYKFFPNESVWIAMQLVWQCVLVASLVVDILLLKLSP